MEILKLELTKIYQFIIVLLVMLSSSSIFSQNNDWVAPEESKNIISPVSGDAKAQEKGKKIYFQICATCHGRTGVGDGPGGEAFNPKPADHTSANVQKQSDGELYWKITNGRNDMPTYNQLLSKTQRWQVIEFIRQLNAN